MRLTKWMALAALALFLAAPAGCAMGPEPARPASPQDQAPSLAKPQAGALREKSHLWRGGVIGAPLGQERRATVSQISDLAVNQAAQSKAPVAYTNAPGTRRLEAQPIARLGNCATIKERFFDHGQLVRESQRQVCE